MIIRTEPRRTLRLDDHLIVIECVRAARLEQRYGRNADDEPFDTFVWFHGLEHPVSIRGDHLDALAKAIGESP